MKLTVAGLRSNLRLPVLFHHHQDHHQQHHELQYLNAHHHLQYQDDKCHNYCRGEHHLLDHCQLQNISLLALLQHDSHHWAITITTDITIMVVIVFIFMITLIIVIIIIIPKP